MRKLARNKNGQFVIIAVLLVAIMIVSIGALLHDAASYYKQEPWEEYTALIGDVELNSQRLIELSLVDYTNRGQEDNSTLATILDANLKRWQEDLRAVYPIDGIILDYSIIKGGKRNWNTAGQTAYSEAYVDFELNITSIGLEGYKFSTKAALQFTIINSTLIDGATYAIFATVKNENNEPIKSLSKTNFRVNGTLPSAVSSAFDSRYILVYRIQYEGTASPTVEVWDQRGIRVVARGPS
jgi:hypothetical protein